MTFPSLFYLTGLVQAVLFSLNANEGTLGGGFKNSVNKHVFEAMLSVCGVAHT